jgi:hypothetical protein
MKKNLANWDRALRIGGTVLAAFGALLLPAHVGLRAALGLSAVYLLWSSLAGTCLGYRLLGMSSCPRETA